MKYVIYARKSSEDERKQIRSIPDQLDWARAVAREKNFAVVQEFTDTKTATKPGREGLNAMITMIHSSSEPMGIITWKMDRLSRNPVDEGTIKYAFMKNKITHIYARDREFREGENQILMGVEFGAATQYSIELSRNVKRGMEGKVKLGWKPGKAPLGYLNTVSNLQGLRTITVDPERFEQVQQMWYLLLDGKYSVPQIMRKVNTEWDFRSPVGKPLARSTLYQIFTNPFYTGMFLYKGQLWEGKHKAMITREQFEQAQAILGSKGQPRAKKHLPSLYSGILRCGECGYSITAEPPKKKTFSTTGNVRVYQYLRCTKKSPTVKCSERYVRREALDEQVLGFLSSIQVNPVFVEWALDELLKTPKSEMQHLSSQKKLLTDKINTITAKLYTLNQKLIASVVDDSTYTSMRNDLMTQKAKIEAQSKTLATGRSSNLENIKELFCFSRDVVKSYHNSTEEEKRIILSKIGSNFSLKDQKLCVELRKPFLPLKRLVSSRTQKNNRFEPASTGSTTGSGVDLKGGHPSWWRTLAEVRNYFEGELE